MKIEIISPSLIVEVKHYAKTHKIDVSEAVEKILKIYLRGMKKND